MILRRLNFKGKGPDRFGGSEVGKGSEEEEDGNRGGLGDKGARRQKHEASGAVLSFFNCLFASVNLKIVSSRRSNFRLLVMFGSFKIPIKIGVPFSFDNFRAMAVHFSFKKSEFGVFKSSQ